MNTLLKIPDKDYHSKDALSSTALKEFIRSPAHYKAFVDNKRPQTDAQRLGSLIHKAILEPTEFDKLLRVDPGMDLKTKDGREQLIEFSEELPEDAIVITSRTSLDSFSRHIGDKLIVKESEFENIKKMQQVAHEHKSFYEYLSAPGRIVEHCVFDNIYGCDVKIKPDLIVGDYLIDYKTTQDASTNSFKYDIRKYKYDFQLIYYGLVLKHATGKSYNKLIIAQEKQPPFAIQIYEIEHTISSELQIVELIETFQYHKEADSWPSYYDQTYIYESNIDYLSNIFY